MKESRAGPAPAGHKLTKVPQHNASPARDIHWKEPLFRIPARRCGTKWTSCGRDIGGTEDIWITATGPRLTMRGERSNDAPDSLSQAAATVAAPAGEDRARALPRAA